jgi:hypothetical protein
MRIVLYECHNILLICVAFGSDVFIVVHPLDPKDEISGSAVSITIL